MVLIGLVIGIVIVLRRNKRIKVRERKEENQQASEKGSGSFFFFYLEESEISEIHAAVSYCQWLLPMQQVPPLPLLHMVLVLLTVRLTERLYGLYVDLKG